MTVNKQKIIIIIDNPPKIPYFEILCTPPLMRITNLKNLTKKREGKDFMFELLLECDLFERGKSCTN
jgi:hypothetical protein